MSLSKLASEVRRAVRPVTEIAAEAGGAETPEEADGKKKRIASSSAREVKMFVEAMLYGSASAVESKAKRIVPEEMVSDFMWKLEAALPSTIALVLKDMGVGTGGLGAQARTSTRKLISGKP